MNQIATPSIPAARFGMAGMGRSASDSKDWLRRKAYKLKRAMIRNL